MTAHLDFYKTFSELAGAKLPQKMQELEGRSLLPLLEDPRAEWADRIMVSPSGRWAAGKRERAKFVKSAVRTQRWRFVENRDLYDISKDPGEKTNVATQYPEVVENLRAAYDDWWESAKPLMVNEGLPTVKPEDQPFALLYAKKLKEKGIPDWAPPPL
jgi:arylsulfatase A-like enzyme